MGRAARAGRRAVAAGLRRLGVGRGDRVAAYLPNIPETIVAFLACAALGAVWSSCAPDFGAPSVVDRFAQIEPKVLLAVDGYRYGGRDFDRRDEVAGTRARAPVACEHTVVLAVPRAPTRLDGTIAWDELTRAEAGARSSSSRSRSTIRSGSSTRPARPACPKPIVHGQGGILLEHLKKLAPAPATCGRTTASSGSRRPAG